MPDAGTLANFVLIVIGLILIPGPAVLLTLARAIGGGRRVGLATGLGIAVGDLVHTLFAAIGLSALLMTSALAFEVVKYLGAAYLVYLGLRAIFAKADALDLPASRMVAPASAFRQAIMAEILNPKTALFFLAFLPQFVEAQGGETVLQIAVLGLIFVAVGAAYTSLIALGAGGLRSLIAKHRGIARWQGKVVGCVYLGLGMRLALQER